MDISELNIKSYMVGLYQVRSYRNLSSFFSNILDTHNLKYPEWTFLGILNDASIMNVTTMAKNMNVKQPMVTRLSQQLEKKGYVRTIKDNLDSRVKYMEMSSAAKRKVENIETELEVAMKPLLKTISRKELTCYVSVLVKLSKLDVDNLAKSIKKTP